MHTHLHLSTLINLQLRINVFAKILQCLFNLIFDIFISILIILLVLSELVIDIVQCFLPGVNPLIPDHELKVLSELISKFLFIYFMPGLWQLHRIIST